MKKILDHFSWTLFEIRQITSRDDHAVQLIKFEWAMVAKRRQSIITVLTTLPQGWVSARKHQCMTAMTMMWTESSWAFPERYTAGSCARVMADNRETKGHITPPPRWVSAQLLYIWSLHDSDHKGVVRIFVALSCELWGYLFTLINYIITLRGTIFPLPGV